VPTDLTFWIRSMLYLAAALQVISAVVALMLIPVSGMRRSWLFVCAGLIIQAGRRVYAVTSNATLAEAMSALAVSILLLAGIVGIRAVFVSLRRSRQALDAGHSRDRHVTNRAGAAIVVLELDGRIREINDDVRALTECGDRHVVGLDWFDTFVPAGRGELSRAALRQFVESAGGSDEYVESTLMDASGREHTVMWHRRLLYDLEGLPNGVRCAGVDMTGSTFLERELAFRSLLLDHTNDSVLVYGLDGRVVYANDTACAYRGVRREDLIGCDVRSFMPAVDADAFVVHMETVMSGTCVTYETQAVDREGIVRPLESRTCPVTIGGDHLAVDVARDITERREAEAAIRRMAYTDHLTGLPNRVLLSDRAGKAMARAVRSGEQLALLFMDLDKMKQTNDSMGHAAGDELLRQVGRRLGDTFRDEDTVARIGGDEFVVLSRVTDVAAAEVLAARLLTLLREPFVVGGDEVLTSSSVGVAIFPRDGDDLETLMAKADAAMYEAKDGGRNSYRVHTADTEPSEGGEAGLPERTSALSAD
jgi:diguanylate cyclase (GGDEF)-like protein/PAS domain S-box-containing protein